MNADWQEILTSRGLELSDGKFNCPAGSEVTNVLCPVTSDAVLHVSGNEAESFLQGQFSNDIAALTAQSSHLSTWSNPKGRVIVVLRVVKVEDGYLIKLPASLLEPVLKRLRMYVLMAKVVIEERPDLLVVGVSGEDAVQALKSSSLDLPKDTDETGFENSLCMVRVRGAVPRFEMIGNANQLKEIFNTCSDACEIADESVWRLQNIDAGIPSVTAATTEAFVLQMMNLHHIDGVSFKKGCFPGQEVVARMHYLGKLKRQMYRFELEGEKTPASGDEIFRSDSASAVGKVVDAVKVGGNTSRLLAVMSIDAINENLYLDKEGGQALRLSDLPYALVSAE